MTPYLFPLAIVSGIVAMIYYTRWRTKSENARLEQRTDELIAAVVAVKLERYPELAAVFTRYIRECFRVDLSQMDFKQHITYVGKHLKKFRRRDYSRYFPGGEGEFVAAVSANLSEVIALQYNAHWELGDKAPFFPFLILELNNNKKTYCCPARGVIVQMVQGDGTQAIGQLLLPLENTQKIAADVAEFANSIQVDDDKTELELNGKLAKTMQLTQWVIYGLLALFMVVPALFLIFDKGGRLSIVLATLGVIDGIIVLSVLFNERWATYQLPRYRKLVMYKNHFSLEGDNDTLDISYNEVKWHQLGYMQFSNEDPEAILKLKTPLGNLSLKENYFTYPAGARMVLSEIAKRIEDAKQGENHAE